MMASKSLVFRFADVEVREREFTLIKAGKVLTVEPKAFRTLLFLLHNPQRLISKEELLNTIWGDAAVTEGSLTRCIWLLRSLLGDDIRQPHYIATVATVGYRFVCKVEVSEDSSADREAAGESDGLKQVIDKALDKDPKLGQQSAVELRPDLPRWKGETDPAVAASTKPSIVTHVTGWALIVGAASVTIGLAAAAWFSHSRKVHALRDTDTVVLIDFVNSTGDPVFDDTLKQGLATELQQSPFLNILPDRKVSETLKLMGHSGDEHLELKTALELCQRAESKAVLMGSIASLGSEYVIGLNALNCQTGGSFAREQVQAANKEKVLDSLYKATTGLREKLGESLSTVQEFDIPLEQATTPSLDALHAYSLGRKALIRNGDWTSAESFFQQAIELDPNFAMAHLSLGLAHFNLREIGLAGESFRKAYELRARASEWERLAIESRYYHSLTGDLMLARQTTELWAQKYPRDAIPIAIMAAIDFKLGQYEIAAAEGRDSVRLDPSAIYFVNLGFIYICLNRMQEAQAVVGRALKDTFDSPDLHEAQYDIDFMQANAAGMAQQMAWSAGKQGAEGVFLAIEADTAAYFGQLDKARVFSRQAVASAHSSKEPEAAARFEAQAALREALFGNTAGAQHRASAALGFSTSREVQFGAALALALAGDAIRAQTLVNDLGKRFPEDTIVQLNYLPAIQGQLLVKGSNTSRAIVVLQPAVPHELGTTPDVGLLSLSLYPVYVRGEAYLAADSGSEAAVEFQKILDHRGIVGNAPIGALAYLGLARAYALQGDKVRDRAAYQDFLSLWKDADPDIPVLKQAKAEYAKLQ
jgi:DNA-binding winged helix-turn-helix (wHTH) protein/predicted Zn-dependent protease